MIAYFDIETNGLYHEVTQGHCMVIKIVDKVEDTEGETLKYRHHEGVHEGALKLLSVLQQGGLIIGHNIIDYDIPVLEKLYSDVKFERKYRSQIFDTLVLTQALFGDIGVKDIGLCKVGRLPAALKGRQSLEAWGYRLGELKGTYGHQEDAWVKFSETMLDYNVQDVVVTEKLYKYLMANNWFPEAAIETEHKAQWLMAKQGRNGFNFDKKKAEELAQELEIREAVLAAKLVAEIPEVPDKVFIPKRDNKRLGYVAGVAVQKFKDFNPRSRQQLEWVIREHFKYTPDNTDLYEGERLKVDGETFEYLKEDPKAPEKLRSLAGVMDEYLNVSKILGMVKTGKGAWLRYYREDTGCIHGRVNPCGTVTGRATHSSPNVAQVPRKGALMGEECRSLFTVPKGWVQAGIDASGLELRCLAHFMYPYDNGAYAHEILNGDIHTANQLAAGLPTRDNAKTFDFNRGL